MVIRKLLNRLNDNSLVIEIGIYTIDKFYIIPSIAISKTGKYLELELFIFFIELYSCFSIKNLNYES